MRTNGAQLNFNFETNIHTQGSAHLHIHNLFPGRRFLLSSLNLKKLQNTPQTNYGTLSFAKCLQMQNVF